MRKYIDLEAISIGLAMFSMFFGAGNVIFPLAIGQYAGDKHLFAVLGLLLTAVLMPFAGVFAMILFHGNCREFFGRLGRWPGFILALIVILLLGPLGSTPRCIALMYTTIKPLLPAISPAPFSALICLIIFLFTMRKNRILPLLGWILTPVLLATLIAIIFLGFLMPSTAELSAHSHWNTFWHGLQEGYNTMDLLAAFFFSSTTLALLKAHLAASSKSETSAKNPIKLSLQASVIGGSLLALIYLGFSFISSYHGATLEISGKDQLLSAITMKIAGPYAGILACAAIGLACLTTAIALISVFSDFVQKEVFREKIGYPYILSGALLLTFFVSTFEFTGISAFLGPVLQICYPGLIVLTFLNIAHKLTGFTPLRVPVFGAFVVALLLFLVS